MKRNLLLSVFLFSGFFNFAQELKTKNLVRTDETFTNGISQARTFGPNGIVRCASTEYLKSKQNRGLAPSNEVFEEWLAPKLKEIKKQRSEGRLPAVIRIPVVVHVIHNGDPLGTGENIADGQVLSQITVFNQDFRKLAGTPGNGAGVDTTIEFCLAVVDPNGNPTNGIDRVSRALASYAEADVEAAKAATIWDPTKYLNMWTFRFGGDLAGVLGYAQFPSGSGLAGMPTEDCIAGEASTDGVVCSFDTWGSRNIFPAGSYGGTSYDKGRTMTHEVGHMLGLRHIWGDDGCPSGTTNVATNEDFCADTPASAAANFGCPTGTDSCPTIPGEDQIENYMDYTDDACMNMFTQEQKDRMLAVLMNSPRRDDLLVSTVCNTPQATIQFKRLVCESRVQNSDKTEGNGCSFTDYTIPLNINKAPTANAVVTFTVDAASTANANDFAIMTPTVTFNSGSTADQNLVVRVYNDAYIESVENIVINFTVNANGGDAVANAEGNKLTFSILNDDVAPSSTVVNTLINEDFEDSTGWTLLDADADRWGIVNGAAGVGTAPNLIVGRCAYSEKSRSFLGGTGNATPNNYFISPQVTIPTGAVSVNLSYIMAGYGATAGNYTVYFTTNISSEANITSGTVLQSATTIGSGASVLRNHSLLALAGQTGYIVFRHSNLNTATGLLLLDSVLLTSTFNTNVQTAVNTATSGNNSLKGAGTATFYDSVTTRNIMTGITVNSATDFGCTSVAVSRAGTGALQYGSVTGTTNYAMSKQFTITPTNIVTGNSTITFYFTEAEIAGWEAATSNTRSLLYVVRDGVTREIQPVTIGSFGATGVTLTATFTNGIQGVYSFAKQASLPAESFELTDINLYPNPNNGNFSVQFTPSSDKIGVTVFDMRGRVIYDRRYQNNGLFNETIQLDNVQSGVYLVKVQDGSRSLTKKIVVE